MNLRGERFVLFSILQKEGFNKKAVFLPNIERFMATGNVLFFKMVRNESSLKKYIYFCTLHSSHIISYVTVNEIPVSDDE